MTSWATARPSPAALLLVVLALQAVLEHAAAPSQQLLRPVSPPPAAARAAPPRHINVSFSTPVTVGSSNTTHFYFPSIAIAMPDGGGELVQHVTLCDDRSTCDTGRCAQVLRSSGGVAEFTVQSTTHAGGSGSFNYYGDLGELVPPASTGGSNAGSSSSSTGSSTSSSFVTLAGNNGGSWLGHPVVLQHWALSNTTGRMHIGRNTTAQLIGTPPQFTSAESCGSGVQKCGLAQGGRIIRDAKGVLVAAFGGFASDGPRTCKPDEAGWTHCYSLAFYRSQDDGLTWNYSSRLDQTAAMPTRVEGPCEPTLALLNDGRILLMFRLESAYPLWQAYSNDGAASWSEPTLSAGLPWSVWPQLLLLSNGVLALSSGRPGIGLWLSADGAGEAWEYYNIAAEHNRHAAAAAALPAAAAAAAAGRGEDGGGRGASLPSAQQALSLPLFAKAVASVVNASSADINPTQTTSYTSLVEVSPGVLVVSYDLLRVGCPIGKTEKWCQAKGGLGYDGGRDYVFAMKVNVSIQPS